MAFANLLAMGDEAIRDILGASATYAPSTGSPVTVTGIFDKEFVKVELGEAGITSCGPSFWCLLSDLPVSPDPTTDSPTLTVSSVSYVVHERQPDGQGGIRFLLHQV